MKARAAVFVILAVFCLVSCDGGERKKSVTGLYKALEKAYRNGDGKLWLNLQSKQTLESLDETYQDHIKKNGIPSRPNISMTLLSSIERSDEAALFVKYVDQEGADQYEALRLILEDGGWKITEMEAGNTPIYPHTFFPPQEGAFMKSGANWEEINPVLVNEPSTTGQTSNWSLRGAIDESFLYIRLECNEVLPAPGSELSDPAQTVAPSVSFPIDIAASATGGAASTKRHFHVVASEGGDNPDNI